MQMGAPSDTVPSADAAVAAAAAVADAATSARASAAFNADGAVKQMPGQSTFGYWLFQTISL